MGLILTLIAAGIDTNPSSLTPRHQTLTLRHRPLTPRHQPRTPRHQPLTPRHQPLTPRHQPLTRLQVLQQAFGGLEGELAGKYYELGGLTDEQRDFLLERGFLFQIPTAKNLLTGAGAARSWWVGRNANLS